MPFILTIDDSPTSKTDKLLDFLSEQNIHALFFCIGKEMKNFPEVIDKMILNGHIVGNHSFSHKKFSKINNINEEIDKTDKLIEWFYKKNGKKRDRKYFRFPYQDKGVGWNPIKLIFRAYSQKFILAQSILKSLGYENFPLKFRETNNIFLKDFINDLDVFTNLNLKDWKTNNSNSILRKINKLDIDKNYILQLHDKDNTLDNTIEIIKKIKNKGARFVLP